MWVVYLKKERRIVHVSAYNDRGIDKKTILKKIIRGLMKPGKFSDYDAIQVKDRKKAREYKSAFPSKLVLKGSIDNPSLAIEEPEVLSLIVKSDAKEKHPVDGIPVIPSDGKSYTTISIGTIDEKGKSQIASNDTLYLRTDHGILQNAEGTEDINSINLSKGAAAFRLVSEKFKRVATVQVLSPDPNVQNAGIRVEFI